MDVSDCAYDPVWCSELVARASRARRQRVVGEILGGDAVEPGQPLLEAAVVRVEVVDVQVRRLGVGFSGAGTPWNRIPALRAKAAIAFPPSPTR